MATNKSLKSKRSGRSELTFKRMSVDDRRRLVSSPETKGTANLQSLFPSKKVTTNSSQTDVRTSGLKSSRVRRTKEIEKSSKRMDENILSLEVNLESNHKFRFAKDLNYT